MSCSATVIVTAGAELPDGGAALARTAVGRLHELEQRWSRFLRTSEISGLNAAGGEPRIASPDTVRLVRHLVEAWHATGGAFDPTLLGTLVELGYASSRDDITLRTSLAADIDTRGRPGDVLIDARTGWIRLPRGTTLDPGGLGKGLAADIVAEELIAAGAAGALVEVGGDLRVIGTPPTGDRWTIAVSPVTNGDEPRRLELVAGGVATSTSRLRTWRRRGEQLHHLVDPRTLRPAANDVASCTVIAGTAAWAEAFTKVAFAEPVTIALERYDARRLAAMIVDDDLGRHSSCTWKEFTR